jgi:signal transduction histidine kinase
LEIIADRNIYEPGSGPRLPALTRDLEITDTALSFTLPKKVRFRYKLEGMDNDWQGAGPPRQAFYTNLRPGHSRFHVIACNNDGVWNEAGAALEFNILAAFYQTNWFLIFCVAAAGCLAWTGFQWRVRQMAARLDLQFRERVSERTRVAQDLHDTLLQGFLSASMQLQVAATHLPDDWPAKTMVGEVLDLMRSAIEDGRNALRGLRSWQETCDLTQAFSRISQELAIQRQANYGVIVEGQPRSLHPVVRDEVYRIAREAVVNAFRHSQASGIELELKYATDQLQILVRDDGCGIDPQVLHAGREGHWGLPGMRERAERIGAKLKVLSRPAGGTEMELSVPGDVAFRLYSPSRVGRKARWHRRKAEPGDREQKDRRAV